MTITSFTPEEISRYQRHFMLPQIGYEGQQRLKNAKVLIVGAGGLGSASALYLTAAGIGTLGIVEYDRVELSNLQRQILHSSGSLGRSKVASAVRRLKWLNPNVELKPFKTRLTAENAEAILSQFDLVIDGSDNFSTRYLINDACVLLKKPFVYGSVYRFEGQISLFHSQHGPCYRCLFPVSPPEKHFPNCAEGGVLGVLPGIVGTFQATEALKYFLGIGHSLIGRLLMIDTMNLTVTEITVKRDHNCSVCGETPSILEIRDEPANDETTITLPNGWSIMDVELSVKELKEKMDRGDNFILLDVREKEEYQIANIGGKLIPLGELPARLNELNTQQEIVVHCHTGRRSAYAVGILLKAGFKNSKNLLGGIQAWSNLIDPGIPLY